MPKGRERRREVKADLDSFEPPAERLRRCDGDTGPQRVHFFPQGGKCASAQALPSRRMRREGLLSNSSDSWLSLSRLFSRNSQSAPIWSMIPGARPTSWRRGKILYTVRQLERPVREGKVRGSADSEEMSSEIRALILSFGGTAELNADDSEHSVRVVKPETSVSE